MSAIFEGRLSDSPYIEIIWRGRVDQDYDPVCPADMHWNLLASINLTHGLHLPKSVKACVNI